MSKKENGYGIHPSLDDTESVLADDESSEVSSTPIYSPRIHVISDSSTTRSSDNSSEITVSTLSMASTEHSSVEEISARKDVTQNLEISPQRNISTNVTEKTAMGSNFDVQPNPLDENDVNVASSNVPSVSKKRVLEDPPHEKLCRVSHENTDTASINSEDCFKRFKLADDSKETASKESPHTSIKSCNFESFGKQGKVIPQVHTEDILPNILSRNLKKFDVGDPKVECYIDSFEESTDESENSKISKGGKRKMSSPEMTDSKIKVQKLAASTEFGSRFAKSLCTETEKTSGSNLSSQNPDCELDVHQAKKTECLSLTSAQAIDSSISVSCNTKELEESPYATLENSEISDNSTGAASVSGSVSSFEEHVNIDLDKLSPAVLDEDALLSAPEKSNKFVKSETSASKEKSQLKEVKLSITACIKKDTSQNTEKSNQSPTGSKNIEKSASRTSENPGIDTEHSVIKQDLEISSVLSSNQEILHLSGETSIASSELSVSITQSRESPALIEEIAMISPPDRLKETRGDFSELGVTESPNSKIKDTPLYAMVGIKTIQDQMANKPLCIGDEVSGKFSGSSESKELSTEETLLTSSSSIIKSPSDLSFKSVDTESKMDKTLKEQDKVPLNLPKQSSELCDVSRGYQLGSRKLPTEEIIVSSSKLTAECGTSSDLLSSESTRQVEKDSPSSGENTNSEN